MKSSRLFTALGASALSAVLSLSAAFADVTSYARPGFYTEVKDGRLLVFWDGSEDLKAFKKDGELAKSVSRIGAGPDGMTIKAPDAATIARTLVRAGSERVHRQRQAGVRDVATRDVEDL